MFDLDEGFHALQNLDSEGREALKLAGKLWAEIYRDEHQHVPAPLTRRYLTELSERTEQVRVLRERLDDVLDSREEAELRAEHAESLLQKVRTWAASWSLGTELNVEMAHWRSLCQREPHSPPPWDDERIEQCERELQLLRRELKAAREAEYLAIDRMKQERARAEAAEQKCNVLRSEIRALYYRKGRP